MRQKEFDDLLEETITEIRATLFNKGSEYATFDRLDGFKSSAAFNGITVEQALWFFVTKHIIALRDFIRKDSHGDTPPYNQWKEKTGDIINYMILLRAILKDRGVV
jgi:hypothetical protein